MAAAKKKTATRKTAAKRVAKKSTARKVTKASTKRPAAKKAVRKAPAKKAGTTAKKSTPNLQAQFASVSGVPAAAQKNATEMLAQSNQAITGWMETTANELQKAQDKIFAVSRESADHLTRSTNSASGSLQNVVDFGRDQVEACVECGNIAAGISQSMSEEMVDAANRTIAQNVELSKDMFNCRTLNDIFDLQSRFMKANMENFFNESIKMSEMMFQTATDASQPLNERMNQAGEKMKELMNA